MECPHCKSVLKEIQKDDNFCTKCGAEFPEEFKNRLKGWSDAGASLIPGADSPARTEYRKALHEILTKGRVTTDKILFLAHKKRDLRLGGKEAIILQREVAESLGIAVHEESDFLSGDILLEINENKSYRSGEHNDLEFLVTNISDDRLGRIQIIATFMHLRKEEPYLVRRLDAHGTGIYRKAFHLPFMHEASGTEIVEVTVEYVDGKGNPSVYSTQFDFKVFEKGTGEEIDKSINVSIQAGKIISADFEKMIDLSGQNVIGERPASKKSFCHDHEKQWKKLPLFFDEEETNNKRNQIQIRKKLDEGETFLREALKAEKKADLVLSHDPGSSKELLEIAVRNLESGEGCFKKVREIDPEHEEALAKATQVRSLISDLERRMGAHGAADSHGPTSKESEFLRADRLAGYPLLGVPKTEKLSALKMSSAILTLADTQKKIFMYSKDRISLGRLNRNDIVLRIVPYEPGDQYPENYRKTMRISGTHGDIINRNGYFHIRDRGKDDKGSKNGTYLNGKRLLPPCTEFPLQDGSKINIAGVLDLECNFMWTGKTKKHEYSMQDSCFTVLGEMTESCFGVDVKGAVNAIRIRRGGNFPDGEEYVILVREISLGRSLSNGIVVEGEDVSDIHAKIFYRDGRYWIEDLNSRHGTWVDDRRIEPTTEMALAKRAVLTLGTSRISFEGNE